VKAWDSPDTHRHLRRIRKDFRSAARCPRERDPMTSLGSDSSTRLMAECRATGTHASPPIPYQYHHLSSLIYQDALPRRHP